MSDSVRPHRRQPTRLPHPWDSPGKNSGVGCHFLLQCMKVKIESEVAQSCPTPRDPIDCGLQGSSLHGIFQARVLEWVAIAFSAHELAGRFFTNSTTWEALGNNWDTSKNHVLKGLLYQNSYLYTLTWRFLVKELSLQEIATSTSSILWFWKKGKENKVLEHRIPFGSHVCMALGKKDIQIWQRAKVEWMRDVFKRNFEL